MTNKITGSCLCGAIAYQCDPPRAVVHCHCRTCQKAQASAFNTAGPTTRSGFKWTRGEEFIGDFTSTPGKSRNFCTKCGSQLLSHWHDRDEVILRIATLDQPLDMKPSAHIWTSHKAWFDTTTDDLPRYPEFAPPAK